MKNDLADDYSIQNWLRSIKLIPHDGKPNWKSKLGLLSIVLAVFPLLGIGFVKVIVMFTDTYNNVIDMLTVGTLWATCIIAPVIGLLLGLICLWSKPICILFPTIGTILNVVWVIVLILINRLLDQVPT